MGTHRPKKIWTEGSSFLTHFDLPYQVAEGRGLRGRRHRPYVRGMRRWGGGKMALGSGKMALGGGKMALGAARWSHVRGGLWVAPTVELLDVHPVDSRLAGASELGLRG